MKKLIVITCILVLFTVAYAQEIGYDDKIEEAIANCKNCNVCPDGKVIDEGKICVYFFFGQGCPHCAEEKPFLEEMKNKYPELEIYDFEVYYNQDNVNFWEDICKKYNVKPYGVPMTFIGNKVFIGFNKKVNTFSFLSILGIALGCIVAIILVVFLLKGIKVKVKT